MSKDYDIVIRNGMIVDGLMTPAYKADLAIQDGLIAKIGVVDERGREEIDAEGRHVVPGFVDMHTHMDGQVFWDPAATPSCFHGITSIMVANCGFALAPARPEARDWVMKMLSRVEGIAEEALREGVSFTWNTYAEYLDAVSKQRLGVNVGAMVPHSTLRYEAMGEDARKRAATPEETAKMAGLFREAMNAGGFGFSSSWNNGHADADGIPVPSRFAERAELLALCAVLKEYSVGGIEFTPKGLMEGVAKADFELMGEMSRVAGGKPINWNALIDLYGHPGYWREELEMMEEEVRKGARIFAINSCFPIDADFCLGTAGNLFDDYPHWSAALSKPLAERTRLFADAAYRAKMKEDMEKLCGLFSPKWEDVEVVEVEKKENEKYVGKRITAIAAERGVHPIDALLDLAVSEGLATKFFRYAVQNADEKAIADILRHPLSIPGVSDGGAHLEYLCQYGWPVKLLADWTRDRGVLSIEDAVRRISFLPAQTVGLRNRGQLSVGSAADVVVLNLPELGLGKVAWAQDLPGGASRKVHYPTGIDCVLVNGGVTIRDGKLTGVTTGRVLRSTDGRTRVLSESASARAAE